MESKPTVIIFDVIETLFSLKSLAPRFQALGLPAEALPLFFARMLRDAFAAEVAGSYAPFREMAKATLSVTASSHGLAGDESRIDAVLDGFAELEPHPDVREAFERIHLAELRILTLTNGSADNTAKLLARSGLADFVEKTISIDAVGHWKPHRDVYLHAVREAGVHADRVALIAAHAWDTHGAKQAGLRTGWVQRGELQYSAALSQPDAQGRTLGVVVEQLLAYPPDNQAANRAAR